MIFFGSDVLYRISISFFETNVMLSATEVRDFVEWLTMR